MAALAIVLRTKKSTKYSMPTSKTSVNAYAFIGVGITFVMVGRFLVVPFSLTK